MKITMRHFLDFIFTFVGSAFGGLVYSVSAGRQYNWAFNFAFGTVIGVFVAARLHKKRQRLSRAQQQIP